MQTFPACKETGGNKCHEQKVWEKQKYGNDSGLWLDAPSSVCQTLREFIVFIHEVINLEKRKHYNAKTSSGRVGNLVPQKVMLFSPSFVVAPT